MSLHAFGDNGNLESLRSTDRALWFVGGASSAHDPIYSGSDVPPFSSVPVVSRSGTKVVKATVAGTGNVSAVVEIYGNTVNENTSGILLATITLPLGASPVRDGFAFDANWPFLYARVTSLTGTAAAVSVEFGS
jgi:hypothetical protein